MGIIVGVIVGYIAGARAGREKFDELREACQVIANSKEVQLLVMAATTFLTQTAESELGQGKESTDDDGVPPEFQRLIAGGSSEQAKRSTGNGVATSLAEQIKQIVTAIIAPRQAD